MRLILGSVIVAFALCAGGCGSYGDSGGSVTAPTRTPGPSPAQTPAPSPSPAPANDSVVTINIVRENGAQSFAPNPATLPAGQMVVWHNIDTTTHRVVLNTGALDTGDLIPSASSAPMRINTGSAGYHCSIHSSMVGSIVQAG
jgi:plastocyanin